ncbi:MAG: prepilin-type N-terminal cleavage/methylation domain-containing protein [Candidatus Margulisiibacteriota bacterium]
MKKGFTLIEVIVSACVISIFFSSFFVFVISDSAVCKRNAAIIRDLTGIESIVESLRNIPFEDIKDSAGITVKDFDPDTKSIEVSKRGFSIECAVSKF